MPLTRITLASGRSIDLTKLQLSSTYSGMLEGYPCKLVNEMQIRGMLYDAELAFPGTPVHLIPPVLEYPDASGGAFGPVEVLPPVSCVGLFHSTALSEDTVLYRSHVAVAWFQQTPTAPSADEAELRDLAWEELARDYEL
ncbi:hypothetical protein OHT76_21345 [Streptomyces sp. NBC_00287]|uniref:hypothetical protein n=1 Tax=Streptomyces sp. NBC_00287 TaxID=2975702 RepID=UPI002E2B4A4F|nr:hypothetical protein [Streptomyces sp. NBC_00287]